MEISNEQLAQSIDQLAQSVAAGFAAVDQQFERVDEQLSMAKDERERLRESLSQQARDVKSEVIERIDAVETKLLSRDAQKDEDIRHLHELLRFLRYDVDVLQGKKPKPLKNTMV